LLICDELGYLNILPEQTNVFFRLMEERYNQLDSDGFSPPVMPPIRRGPGPRRAT